jgi:hypothetical protein
MQQHVAYLRLERDRGSEKGHTRINKIGPQHSRLITFVVSREKQAAATLL